jgi:hypothetical protein
MNRYIVLVCGLNIRSQNRITLRQQQEALEELGSEVLARPVEDKGSYVVSSPHAASTVCELVLEALRRKVPALEIQGAAVAAPAALGAALSKLCGLLASRYGQDFEPRDHGIKIGKDTWRAGLAVPLYPDALPPPRTLEHETKNALIFGWMPGAVLVAKRQAPGIHWGTVVNDPARRLTRREHLLDLELTSRSANILKELVHRSESLTAHPTA